MPSFTDKFDEYTDQIRELIAETQIERAIERLLKLVEPIEHPLLMDVTIIQGNLRALRRSELTGVGFEEAERIRIRNCAHLLSLLQDAKRDKSIEDFFYKTLQPIHRRITDPKDATLGADVYAVLRSDDARVAPQLLNVSAGAIIGRSEDCDIVVDEPRVSRQHTRLFVQNEQLYVEDMGSINKTVMNGKIIEAPTLVARTCTLRLHDVWISLELTKH